MQRKITSSRAKTTLFSFISKRDVYPPWAWPSSDVPQHYRTNGFVRDWEANNWMERYTFHMVLHWRRITVVIDILPVSRELIHFNVRVANTSPPIFKATFEIFLNAPFLFHFEYPSEYSPFHCTDLSRETALERVSGSSELHPTLAESVNQIHFSGLRSAVKSAIRLTCIY